MVTEKFSKKEYNTLNRAVKKRCKHIPLQLIIGYSQFLGIKIIESKHTLTPRPETELLAERITNELNGKKCVLDLCCGSGCIGLALAKEGHIVTCADVSNKALKCAKNNAKLNGLDVKILKSDMFKNISGKFDVMVSNPPYIPSAEVLDLQPEVKNYDPHIALDGGADGLDFYKQIAQNAHNILNPKGLLYLELGINQAQAVKKLLTKNFKNITVIKDYNNIERFIKAEVK